MTDVNTLRRYFERALALAHAAVDDPTPDRIADAQAIGAEVLLLAARGRPAAATLTDGHLLFAHASRLRALLTMLDEHEAATATASTYSHDSGARASMR
jgi:hypothetical protein